MITVAHTVDGSNGSVTVDQYDIYPEDIKMMSNVGMDAYRFSISWSRLIPGGRGPVNDIAVKHYNNLINELLEQGIEPYVTLSHFDIPQALEDEYGGWISPRIVDDFANYAEVCFKLFADRVKYWITINEPNLEASMGYDLGLFPPARCSHPFGNCSVGDSTTEPYTAVHYQLLSHAAAETKNGSVGITINIMWYEPLTNSSEDLKAQSRALDFTLGWIFDPIFYGDYPASMRQIVGSRLPKFSEEERLMVMDSLDFIALNHYTTIYVADANLSSPPRDYMADMSVDLTAFKDGVLIGPETAYENDVMTLYIVPQGLKSLVEYVKWRYNNAPMFITENGMAMKNNETISLKEALNDTVRIEFHRDYLSNLLQAIENGANVRGYFLWSLMDNFEFSYGFTLRFGIVYVDFKHPHLPRYPKLSALWFQQILNRTAMNDPKELASYHGMSAYV
eukprot:Gb_30540 [translate_table: standard]